MNQVKSILILEDEIELRAPLSYALQKLYPAARFEFLTTGEEALRAISAGKSFEVVLSDIILPGSVTGVDFWKAFRERHPDKTFCFMSGLPREFYQSLFDGHHSLPRFIGKPFTSRDLAEALAPGAQAAA
ncbi:MAG: response regulator [Oligoflexia bacterium]|nr:response regulator [Oligoflexia bacterium]